MDKQKCIQISAREQAIVREALEKCIKTHHPDSPEMVKLEKKLRRNSTPKITIGIKGGMVYWMTGNPFPVRVCDYDIDGVYPEYKDELGRPCVISFAPEDESRKASRYTVCE